MEPTNLVLAQALSLIGLVGASGAYAGIIRRRQQNRLEAAAAAMANMAAVERVGRHSALAHLENTFARSAYRPVDRRSPPGR